MFARILTVNLKPGQGPGFAAAIDQEVIPLMRTFAGFQDEIAMVSPDGKRAVGISFWDSPPDAETYNRDGYSRVLKMLDSFVDDKPVVVTYDVTNSTVHHIAAMAARASRT